MFVLDHLVLQLMTFVAEIGQDGVFFDQQLLDALVFSERVRVHLAQLSELIGQTHQCVLHLHRFFVPHESVDRLQFLQFQRQTLLFRIHRDQLLSEKIVLFAIAILDTTSSISARSICSPETYHVVQQLFVLTVQMFALVTLSVQLFDAGFVLELEFAQFLHQQSQFRLAVVLQRVAFGFD